MFASLGDNITPPQQAFNWVADLYPTTEALKANGQVIVGLMHESVGHLGIFVSGKIAKREHTQIVDLIELHRAPAAWPLRHAGRGAGKTDEELRFDVVLTERKVEDLQALQKYGRKDEVPFETVEAASEALASAYETFVHPVISAMVTPAGAAARRACTRSGRSAGPFPISTPSCGRSRAWRTWCGRTGHPATTPGTIATIRALDRGHDLRLAGPLSRPAGCRRGEHLLPHLRPRRHAMAAPGEGTVAEEPVDARDAPLVKEALPHIEDGDRTEAIVRAALLLMKAGTGRRRLSAMKRARDLVGKDIGLLDMPAEAARDHPRAVLHRRLRAGRRRLWRCRSCCATSEDRRLLLDLLDR